VPDAGASPLEATSESRSILGGLLLIVLCCLGLLYIAVVERNWLDAETWSDAIARIDDAPAPEGAIPARFRRLPADSLPPETPLVAAIREQLATVSVGEEEDDSSEVMLDLIGVNLAEMLIMMHAEDADLAKVLDSGRLPRRGHPEVLRGDLARADSFTLDGVAFKVTGRLKASMGGSAFAYLLPEDPALAVAHFSADKGARPGWYATDPSAIDIPKIFEQTGESTAAPQAEQPVAQTRTRTAYAAGSYLALIAGAIGGYLLHRGIFTRLQYRSAFCSAVVASPRLFAGMHLLLYGSFFFAMLRGAQLPLNNVAVSQFVYGQFTTGGLQYVGDAYASGNVLHAAFATFQNNYFMQTFLFTFVLSIVPLALGILKTLLSFVLVGFTMVPIWTGTADGYSFHSITMVLELEAYIVACFVVVLWTRACYRAAFHTLTGKVGRESFGTAIRIYAEGILLTGIMLAVAGLYEALTLITFSHG